jgi:hypothetical protein
MSNRMSPCVEGPLILNCERKNDTEASYYEFNSKNAPCYGTHKSHCDWRVIPFSCRLTPRFGNEWGTLGDYGLVLHSWLRRN